MTYRPLGVYVHIPFCRKRCDFCYFKVYTDKNSAQIAALRSTPSCPRARALRPSAPVPRAGRKPRFVYFGGGTPSYLSAEQLRGLFGELARAHSSPGTGVEELAFECEPGTLCSSRKIQAS